MSQTVTNPKVDNSCYYGIIFLFDEKSRAFHAHLGYSVSRICLISISITLVSVFTYKHVGWKSHKITLSTSQDRHACNSTARICIDLVKATSAIYTLSSTLSPDICRAVQGQKKRCFLCADVILYTVYIGVGTKCMRYITMIIIFVVFVIRLTGYTNGIVRVYMNEKDPLRPRYEVPPGDVVLENTLHTKK